MAAVGFLRNWPEWLVPAPDPQPGLELFFPRSALLDDSEHSHWRPRRCCPAEVTLDLKAAPPPSLPASGGQAVAELSQMALQVSSAGSLDCKWAIRCADRLAAEFGQTSWRTVQAGDQLPPDPTAAAGGEPAALSWRTLRWEPPVEARFWQLTLEAAGAGLRAHQLQLFGRVTGPGPPLGITGPTGRTLPKLQDELIEMMMAPEGQPASGEWTRVYCQLPRSAIGCDAELVLLDSPAADAETRLRMPLEDAECA